MKLIKESILNRFQVAGEVNGALRDYNLVVVTKSQVEDANPVFAVHACQGELVAGQIHETPVEEDQQQ